jgi:hypothetical protein
MVKGSYPPSNRLGRGSQQMHDLADLAVPEWTPATVYSLVVGSRRVSQLGVCGTLSHHTIQFRRRQHTNTHFLGLFLVTPSASGASASG